MKNIDTEKMRKIVSSFQFYSGPSDGNSSAVATVGDVNKVIQHVAKMMTAFINELENPAGPE